VPCFIKWQGKITPSVIKTLGAHIDIFPTLQELCGLKRVKTLPLDGISLAQSLRGKQQDINRLIYTHTAQPERTLKPYPGAVRTPQYRLVVKEKTTELYDMLSDPSQKSNIAKDKAVVTQTLSKAYYDWFSNINPSVPPQYFAPLHPSRQQIELPAYEALFSGNLTFKEGHGWVHDWLINWKNPNDTISWAVSSPKKQRYDITINYTCPANVVGAEVQITVGKHRIKKTLTTPFDPPMLSSPDRVVRKEVYEKKWAQLVVGTVDIPKGKSQIVVTAPTIPHGMVGEIKSVVLNKKR
jgi:hypothetical protein